MVFEGVMVKRFKDPIDREKKLQHIPKPKLKLWDTSMGLTCVFEKFKRHEYFYSRNHL
jgi:hypothetical protein